MFQKIPLRIHVNTPFQAKKNQFFSDPSTVMPVPPPEFQRDLYAYDQAVKAKFHYTSWFGAGSELVRSWFEAKFHYAI